VTIPELATSLASGLVSGLGVWYWAQSHSHPQYVPRSEMDLLRDMLQSQHQAVLRELEQLRADVSRGSRR